MKTVYFVMGPESSGNRMMAQALMSAREWGEGGLIMKDAYAWNSKWVKRKNPKEETTEDILASISTAPDKLLLIRSIPRKGWPNKEWIPIAVICREFLKHGYRVIPIVMSRYWIYSAFSQADRGHMPSFELAKKIVRLAYRYILDELEEAGIPYLLVDYEEFVTQRAFRDSLFRRLDMDTEPKMEFYNADLKYKERLEKLNDTNL
jgi:hypothetical protein